MLLLGQSENGIYPLPVGPSVQTLRNAYVFRDRGVRFIYDSTWKLAIGSHVEDKKLKFDIAASSSGETWKSLPSFSDLERAQRSFDHRAYVITDQFIVVVQYPHHLLHLSPEKLWENFKIERKINQMSLKEDQEKTYFESFVQQVFRREIIYWSSSERINKLFDL